jgi:hypothetical protein
MTTPGNASNCSPVGEHPGGEQWVTSLKSTDVLFGRGSGPNDHEGNVLFRSLIRERKSEYMATNHRQTKAKIAREIVDAVLAKNGRFLKKIDPAEAKELGIPKGVDAWTPVDERTIMEKAKQALRQKAEKVGGDTPPDQHSSPEGTSTKVSLPIPKETLSVYTDETSVAHGAYLPPPPPGNMRHNEAHWNTGHDDQIPMYASSQEHQPGAYLSEEQAHSHRMAELDHERRAEMNVHRSAFYDEEVDDGIENDARRKSLHVEDLIRSFHRVGTDEAGTSQSGTFSSNQESTDSMGTIEPLTMGASNVSMMSMSSILKGALCDTPRSSFTQGGRGSSAMEHSGRSLSSRRSSYTRDDSGRTLGSTLGSRRSSYQRDFSGRTMYSEHSEDNDMSISLSHIDALSGNGPRTGHHVSLVIEGIEGEEDASRRSLSFDPRPIQQMAEQPDNLDEMGDSSKNLIYGALGASSVFSGAETHEYHA